MATEGYEVIRAYIHEWDGNDTHFGILLSERTGERNPQGWRCVFQRFKIECPEELPIVEKDDLNELIPSEWDGGSWADLGRILHQKRPEISLEAWVKRIYAARMSGKIVRKANKDFITTHLVGEKITPNQLWNEIEFRTTRAIRNNENARWADAHFNGKRYIGIAFAADQHIGNPYTDHKRMREDAQLIGTTPNCYAILGGDFIDNFLPADKPIPAAKQTTLPEVQWKMMRHYVEMFGESIVAVVAGNHDQWTTRYAGIDPLGEFLGERGTVYHSDELNLRLFNGKQPYHVAIRHKRRGNSSVHPARVVKKMWEDGESDFDIGVVCHHHTPVTEPFTRHGVERWAIRPGSYKVIDRYAEMLGFARDRPTCPIAILSPFERDIHVFSDLRHGILTLQTLNAEMDE